MDENTIVVLILASLITLVMDLFLAYTFFDRWIKRKLLVKDFPKWAKTKKPLFWFISWSFAIFTNFISLFFYALVFYALVFVETSRQMFAAFAIVLIHTVILGLFYCCIKNLLKEKYHLPK